MGLSNDLVSQFVKITKDTQDSKNETTVYGTIVKYNGTEYVKLDGSEQLTPVSSTAVVKDGERVIVTIKNHTAMVTGNISSPSASDKDVKELGGKISEFEIIVADKVSTGELEAEKARIDNLQADNVTIKGTLTANEADIDKLKADNVAIKGTLTANEADIDKLKANKLDATVADIKYATIENLEATDAKVHNLQADYGDFKVLTADKLTANEASIKKLQTDKVSTGELEAEKARIDNLQADNVTIKGTLTANEADIDKLKADNVAIKGTLTANEADIDKLKANKLDATVADIKYANIDFSNISNATIENFYANSGLIKDVVISDGTITGELIGVTIKGDLIEGNTIVADKLVIKGEDGLYYKLNTNGVTTEAEQTDYNSLNGSVITAKSITATKISVDDLVAFDATIGGFNITENSIYSGVKASVNNSTRGVYLDNQGQIAFGDANNFLKYYKDQNGNYKLEISAGSVKMSTSNKTVEDAMGEMITNSVEEFYQSTSPTTLSGGAWSTTQPTWTDGKYIWRRTKNTYGDEHTEYSPSSNGVCITGNTGPKGDTGAQGIQGIQGPKGDQGIAGTNGKTSYFHIKYSTVANPTTSSQMTETPSTYIGTYVDYTSTDSTDPTKYTWSRFQGAQGAKGDKGIAGTNGVNGETSYLHIAYANSSNGATGFSTTDATNKLYIGQYTDFIEDDSTDYTKYKWTKIKGDKGDQGVQGPKGADGKQYYTWLKYADTPTSGMSDDPTGKNYIGLAYNKTTATESTNYSDYTWSFIKGEKGDTGVAGGKGADGKTYYTWIKYATSSSGANMSDDPTGKTYIGIAYNKSTVTESTKAGDYIWSLIQGPKGDTGAQGIQGIQGPKGDQGIAGTNGKTSYFHIKYSTVANPTTSSQMTETPSTYIGTYVDYTSTDSTDPTKYTWSRFQGAQGAKGDKGIAGTNGVNGETSYLHIAYANSSNGATGFSTTDATNKLYIGQYTDFIEDDSTDYTKYKWTKIKGDKGDQGRGISSTAVTYQAGSSGTTAPTGTWSTSIPTVAANQYLWTRLIITYTDTTTSTSYSIGKMGAQGAVGTGVDSISTEFYLSTSKTSQAGGSWATTMPTWSTGKYLWTRNKIVYKNPTSTVYTTPQCDSSWEAVNNVRIGGRNYVLQTSKEWSDWIIPGEGTNKTRTIRTFNLQKLNLQYGDSIAMQIEIETADVTAITKFVAQGAVNNVWSGADKYFPNPWNNIFSYTSLDKMNTVTKHTRVYTFTNEVIDKINNVGGIIELATRADDLNAEAKWRYRCLKIEIGNKVTDWTPAPEDIDENMEYLNSNLGDRIDTVNDRIDSTASATKNYIDGTLKDYATANDLDILESNFSTNMETTKDGILQSVSKDYTLITETDKMRETLTAMIQHTDENITMSFSRIDGVENTIALNQSNMEKYIRFDSDGIELGDKDSPFKTNITNTEIYFSQNGNKIAYISNNKLYINSAEFLERITVGKNKVYYDWVIRSNNHFSLKVRKG